jgi:DNA polymerase III subunit delta'
MNLNWLSPDLKYFLDTEKPLPHALLITGPAGVGKSAFSMRLAEGLLCETPKSQRQNGLACGKCQACHWLSQGSHPDLRRVMPAAFDPSYDPSFVAPTGSIDVDTGDEAAEKGAEKESDKKKSSEITVDQIRGMTKFLSITGHRTSLRMVIVDPAMAMNNIAANAFLKTLEEPLGNTLIVMLATRASQISATLRSRCVVHPLTLPTAEDAMEFIRENANFGESKNVSSLDEDEITRSLQMAGGMPLRALSIVRGQESAGYRLALDVVRSLPDTGWLQASEQMAQLSTPLWMGILQYWVADLARVIHGAAPVRFGTHAAILADLARAPRLRSAEVMKFIQWLDQNRRWANHPLNAKLFAEETLMRYCKLF